MANTIKENLNRNDEVHQEYIEYINRIKSVGNKCIEKYITPVLPDGINCSIKLCDIRDIFDMYLNSDYGAVMWKIFNTGVTVPNIIGFNSFIFEEINRIVQNGTVMNTICALYPETNQDGIEITKLTTIQIGIFTEFFDRVFIEHYCGQTDSYKDNTISKIETCIRHECGHALDSLRYFNRPYAYTQKIRTFEVQEEQRYYNTIGSTRFDVPIEVYFNSPNERRANNNVGLTTQDMIDSDFSWENK